MCPGVAERQGTFGCIRLGQIVVVIDGGEIRAGVAEGGGVDVEVLLLGKLSGRVEGMCEVASFGIDRACGEAPVEHAPEAKLAWTARSVHLSPLNRGADCWRGAPRREERAHGRKEV